MNGIIEDDQYFDNIEIEKLTLFNLNEELKDKYVSDSLVRELNDTNIYDIIADYNEIDQVESVDRDMKIESKIDEVINSLSDIEKKIKIDHFSGIDKLKEYIDEYQLEIKKIKEYLSRKK